MKKVLSLSATITLSLAVDDRLFLHSQPLMRRGRGL